MELIKSKKVTKPSMTFYPDAATFKAIDDLSKIKGVTRNAVLREATKTFLVKSLRKLISESPEYQCILSDYKKSFNKEL